MVGRKIAELRRNNHMTRKELADKLGVSIATVKNWENDSADPRIENIKCLASVFNTTTDYLLDYNHDYTLAHQELDSDDIVLINALIQHIVNLKYKK